MLANHNTTYMQSQLDAPMPWIGIYVAIASLACSLAMAADVIHGFRSKKLWFPSKRFSLNATYLTLLGVALKLPVDLTTNMWAATDRLAKISSLALMTTAMANFMPSLGSMSDQDILINVTALAILIITMIADICIQIVETRFFLVHRVLFPEEVIAMSLMMLLLLVLASSAIMVLTTKRYLEGKYQEKHNEALSQELSDMGVVTVDKFGDLVKKYWVMAETSSPQFVVARSSTCATSGLICLINALILAQAIVRTGVAHKSLSLTASSYGSSTKWILIAQTIGVIVGTIATSFRWCTAICFRCCTEITSRRSSAVDRRLKDVFKVEDYWTEKLKNWQESSLYPRNRHHKCRRLLYNARGVIVKSIVETQKLIVRFNKLVLVISCFITGQLIKLIKHLKQEANLDSIRSHVDGESISGNETVQSIRYHALKLRGEADLPDRALQSICKEVDKVMMTGRKQKPSNLLQFLQKSCNFKGVVEFDNYQVPPIHGREPENCWSLPVVTLTSIAISLPNIPKIRIDQLVSNVRDGLFFVKIIEKSFYQNREWKYTKKAADFWLGVDLFHRWQEIDLCEISHRSNWKVALEELATKSKKIASKLNTNVEGCPMCNPIHWPPKVISAYSMYRISNTILQACDEESAETDVELFERLSVMIADILAACLTNLAHVITTKCHVNGIEERGKSVHEAALLLGKTEEILQFLMTQRELPAGLGAEPYSIEKWRNALLLGNTTTTSDATTPSSSSRPSSELTGVAITSPEGSYETIH